MLLRPRVPMGAGEIEGGAEVIKVHNIRRIRKPHPCDTQAKNREYRAAREQMNERLKREVMKS